MRERQDRTRKAISANAAKAVPASVLAGVVLTSGALFGMAAQTALGHHGLDLASVRDDLIIARVAQSRSALAWWAWWFVAVAAFFIGPLSVAATRYFVANGWRLRGLRLLVSGALVLALAAIGHLPAAPSTFEVRTGTAVGAAVAMMSAALAALGACSLRAAGRKRSGLAGLFAGPGRDFDPVPAAPPRRGGGSVDSGLTVRRFRPGRSLVSGFRRFGRLVLAGVLALVVLAAVSALSGATVALELVAPDAIRQLLARTMPPAAHRTVRTVAVREFAPGETRTRATVFAPLPAGEAGRARLAVVATIPASELTFAKGYAKRRAAREAAEQHAAREAAEIVITALQFQIKVPDKLRSRAVTLQRGEHGGRPHRHLAADRGARDRDYGVRRHAVIRDPGAHWRDAAYDPPGSHRRHAADNRRAGQSRHGDHDDRFAGFDRYGFAGF